jgi:hypothetical protein
MDFTQGLRPRLTFFCTRGVRPRTGLTEAGYKCILLRVSDPG